MGGGVRVQGRGVMRRFWGSGGRGVGRNERVLARLGDVGEEATIQLDQSPQLLRDAYVGEMGEGVDVILDYLWGEPTEALLAVLSKTEFAAATRETRLVQVGESAGGKITLPAAVVRGAPGSSLGHRGH